MILVHIIYSRTICLAPFCVNFTEKNSQNEANFPNSKVCNLLIQSEHHSLKFSAFDAYIIGYINLEHPKINVSI